GFLLARLLREGLGSPNLDSRVAGTLPLELHRALAEPALQARVSDLEFAHAVLVLEVDLIQDAAILDLRLRKGVRRHGMKLIHASAADLLGESSAHALVSKLKEAAPIEGTIHDGGKTGPEIVVLWGERLTAGPDGTRAAQGLLDLAQALGIAETEGAGLLEVPAQANERGLRDAGVLPNVGPGLSQVEQEGLDARGIAEALT